MYVLLKGFQLNPVAQQIDPAVPYFWSDLDKIKLEHRDQVWTPVDVEKGRIGRMGVAFVTMSFMAIYASTEIFVPNRNSKKEKELEVKREGAAATKEEIWSPLQWKRTNLIFTTYATATFSILIIEFSFWDDFGTYIWFVIIGFDPEPNEPTCFTYHISRIIYLVLSLAE